MELPSILRNAIEERIAPYDLRQLTAHVQSLTQRYTNESGSGKRLLTEDAEAAAYCAVRMPATFGAVTAALHWADACCDIHPRSLLDVGAGTGAATWAASELYALETITCLEREPAMQRTGQALMQCGESVLHQAKWQSFDLTSAQPLPTADLVLESYVLNEMSEENRLAVAERLWNSAQVMLLLVEPGTPVASAQLRRIRSRLLELGAHVAAPCPCETECPMPQDDWCHFRCRVARSRLHKQLKGGDVPYEDEKFSYMAFTRAPAKPASARILRPPFIEKGRITLTLCDGTALSQQAIPRKSDRFKAARKAEDGDAW